MKSSHCSLAQVKPIFDRLRESFVSEDWFEDALSHGDLEQLQTFSALNYKFVHCCDDGHPKLLVKIGTVNKSKDGRASLYYYDADGYCKRLLGNSYSIPVVEHLLRPLSDIFMQREYPDAAYCFAWKLNPE
jgi:hypothetical protein